MRLSSGVKTIAVTARASSRILMSPPSSLPSLPRAWLSRFTNHATARSRAHTTPSDRTMYTAAAAFIQLVGVIGVGVPEEGGTAGRAGGGSVSRAAGLYL